MASSTQPPPATVPTEAVDPLTEETPLFAADARYARQFGGALTRAFVDGLPPTWPREAVVVDSTLVWLSRGLVPNGWRHFHREAYPEFSQGAYGEANAELHTDHISCFFGPAAAEVLRGEVALEDLPPVAPGSGRAGLVARSEALLARIAAGQLSPEVQRAGVPFGHGARTFLRYLPAIQAGFHFWMRATLGSARPIVNGHRNVSNL